MKRPARDTPLFCAVLGAVALFRMWHLGALPIFLDEAGHVEHALHVVDPGRLTFWQLFGDELVNGKFLHVFLYSIVVRWASDPLLGSRSVSVLAGLCTASCCYFTGKRLFDSRTGLTAALFYGVCPFAFFYDRMALADPILTAAGALTLAGAVAVCQSPSWRGAAALAAGMGLAPLAKVTGIAIWVVPPIACLFLVGERRPPAKLRNALLAAYSAAVALVAAIYVPAYYLCPQKPISGVLYLTVAAEPHGGPFGFLAAFLRRCAVAAGWLSVYVRAPFLAGTLAAPFLATGRRRHAVFLMTVAAALILIPAAATSILFSRHIMWAAAPLMMVAAAGLIAAADRVAGLFGSSTRRRAAAGAALLALVSAPPILWDYTALSRPDQAGLPAADRTQYIEGWPSGYGVDQAAAFLKPLAAEYVNAAKAGYLRGAAANSFPRVNVVCAEYSSTAHFGLRVLLAGNSDLFVRYTPLQTRADFGELLAWARGEPTYVVLDRPPLDPRSTTDLARLAAVATRVATFPKPGGIASIDIYRVTPP
jgi:hypothetical protein